MELLARFEGVDAAFLIDACWSARQPGPYDASMQM